MTLSYLSLLRLPMEDTEDVEPRTKRGTGELLVTGMFASFILLLGVCVVLFFSVANLDKFVRDEIPGVELPLFPSRSSAILLTIPGDMALRGDSGGPASFFFSCLAWEKVIFPDDMTSMVSSSRKACDRFALLLFMLVILSLDLPLTTKLLDVFKTTASI